MKNIPAISFACCLLAGIFISSCNGKPGPNELTDQEKKDGWALMFDGKTTNGWHLYNKGAVPSAWTVDHEELYCRPNTPDLTHGDLVSDKEYENFDLKFEWKISPEGNSGVFINVLERPDILTAWASGPEYQLLEKNHPDYAASEKKRAGCLYGFAPQKNPVDPKPPTLWNQGEIKQTNGKIQFYLNDVLTAEQDLTTQAWQDSIANTNFKNFPEFGKHTKGHIALQDWAKGISFRNMKIREM